jgi:Zn-dependent protease
MAIWLAVAFVGVLAHELGHAFAVRRLGLRPAIELFAFGGVTSWQSGRQLSPGQRALISVAGPAVGLAIGIMALAFTASFQPTNLLLDRAIQYIIWVNLGWGLLNLLPILPLDGGHIVTSIAEMAFGPSGHQTARILSVAACVILGVAALAAGWLWSAIIAGVLAYSNIQALRAT